MQAPTKRGSYVEIGNELFPVNGKYQKLTAIVAMSRRSMNLQVILHWDGKDLKATSYHLDIHGNVMRNLVNCYYPPTITRS